MKASAVGGLQQQMPPVAAGKATGRRAHAGSHPDGPQGVARGHRVAAGDGQETTSDPVGENPTERAEGVLRLLQEGHFRGVADVRLRINFHEELAAIQHEAAKNVAPDKLQNMSDAVNGQLDALIESGDLTEEQQATVNELRQTFLDAMQQLTDEFLAAEGLQSDALASGLQDAFDALLESLSSLLLPDEPPAEPVDEQPDVEPPVDEGADGSPDAPSDGSPEQTSSEAPTEPAPDAFDAEAYLGELSASFNAALADLVETLQTTDVLPELSPPNGNGVAYAKFLAIYRELWGLADGGQPPPEEPLDTVA